MLSAVRVFLPHPPPPQLGWVSSSWPGHWRSLLRKATRGESSLGRDRDLKSQWPFPKFQKATTSQHGWQIHYQPEWPRVKYLCSLGLRFQWRQNPLVVTTPVSLEHWVAFSLEARKPTRVTKIRFSPSELRTCPHIHVHLSEWGLGQNSQIHRAGWSEGGRQSLHGFPAQGHLPLCPSCRA